MWLLTDALGSFKNHSAYRNWRNRVRTTSETRTSRDFCAARGIFFFCPPLHLVRVRCGLRVQKYFVRRARGHRKRRPSRLVFTANYIIRPNRERRATKGLKGRAINHRVALSRTYYFRVALMIITV